MKTLTRLSLLSIFLLLSPQPYAQTLDRDAVLDKLVDAYGGEQNLRRMEHVVQEWDMVAMMSKRHGKDVRVIRIPGQLTVQLTYPEKVEKRMLDGDQAQVSFNGSDAFPATEPQRDAMQLQLMRLYSPLVLRDKADDVTLTVDGDYHALTLVEHGVRADYLVNTQDWRIEKVAGTLNMGGGSMRFLTEYSDFRFVDGALMHHKENKYAGNVNTAMLVLRNLSFGDSPDSMH
jgi:hypothetical protein